MLIRWRRRSGLLRKRPRDRMEAAKTVLGSSTATDAACRLSRHEIYHPCDTIIKAVGESVDGEVAGKLASNSTKAARFE